MKDYEGSTLSNMEKKVLKELDTNARQGLSSIGGKLKISKQAVNYHMENMIKKGFIKEFITYLDINKLGYTAYNIVIKLKYTTKEEREGIVKKLEGISNVVWILSLRGEWQMVVSILAKDVGEFSVFLEQVLSSLKGKLLDYNFFIVISGSQLGYKKIHTKTEKGHNYQTSIGRKNLIDLSSNDLKVLETIANNAKMSIVDIAKTTQLTVDRARYSLKRLERDKIIQGYKPLVNVSKLGYLWHIMFLRLKASSEVEKKKMINFLKGIHEVCYIVRCVGNCNLMVDFHTSTLDELERVKDKFSNEFSGMIADEKTVQVTDEHMCTYFPGSLG